MKKISTKKKINFLAELNEKEFEDLSIDVFIDRFSAIYRRALHVVEENQRVIAATEALKQGDFVAFGEHMVASHVSLRDNYEVTGRELDTLVDEALKIDGVLGARMTGAGFGGCAVALLRKDKIPICIERIGSIYERKIGYAPAFYEVELDDGVREITF